MKTYGIQTSSKQQGSDKMMVDKLTTKNLKAIFGNNAEYANYPAVVFDNSTKNFYFLKKFDQKNDALLVSNWTSVTSNSDINAKEWVAKNYVKGSIVSKTSESSEVAFYFSTVDASSSDEPSSASSKWFKIPISFSLPEQTTYFTIDTSVEIEDDINRTFVVVVESAISKSGSRIPLVQVNVIKNNGFIEVYYPRIQISTSTTTTITIIFEDDITDFRQMPNNVIVRIM